MMPVRAVGQSEVTTLEGLGTPREAPSLSSRRLLTKGLRNAAFASAASS